MSLIVTLDDARALKYCMGGGRAWATWHGLSWSDFVQNGIEASRLEALDDGIANSLVAQARKRIASNVSR